MQRISFHQVTREYADSVKALDEVSLSIEAGEWVTITGPSGSGKTTLLNLIGLLDTPTSGSIRLDGIEVTSLSRKRQTELRREKIGLVFQQFHLIPYLNALENVMIAQHYHSLTDEGEARSMLETVGLGDRLHHLPSQLSGGEQQRVCIARALINQPALILADEPTGSLDQDNKDAIMDLFQELHAKGHTLVVATHDIDIAKLAQHRIVLSHGHLIGLHPVLGPEEQYMDEILEALWKSQEGDSGMLGPLQASGLTKPLLHKMEREKLLSLSEGQIILSAAGLAMAQERVRRHRLAEKLFMEVLDQDPILGQENACRFEHALSVEIADGICTFLKHPKACPHGKPIPAGPCCANPKE